MTTSGSHAGASNAAVSLFMPGVGVVMDDDSSVFCVVKNSGEKSGHLDAWFRRIPSDPATLIEEPYTFARVRLRARLRCASSPAASATELLESPDSRDGDRDRASVDCPERAPFGSDPECRIAPDPGADRALHYVYLPMRDDADDVPQASATRCIDSITTAMPKGQVTGFDPEFVQPTGQYDTSLPLFDAALMRAAEVGGTDEGAIFFAQGKLYFSFGDTSDLDANDQLTMALEPMSTWRSNVLAHTSTFDVSRGLFLDGFEIDANARAKENVVSPHETRSAPGDEITAIPLAGVGLSSDDGHRYRFLWFVSVHQWFDLTLDPGTFEANYSTLAYSRDESASWTRLDETPTPSPTFGPGTIWFDRFNRYLYFFGIAPDHGGVRLARVRSGYESVVDPTQYQYWNGAGWSANDPAKAVEVISTSAEDAPRSEISVAYNPAADVWMMMIANWYVAPTVAVANQVELWQAPAPTGPWTKLDADAQLPNGNAVATYGPMVSEHWLLDGGLEVPFLLTQNYPVYNVHLWSYRIEVAEAGCPF